MKVYELTDKGRALLNKKDDINYINETIEDAYDAAKYLDKIKHRNRSLVKWTKLGVMTNEKTKRSS